MAAGLTVIPQAASAAAMVKVTVYTIKSVDRSAIGECLHTDLFPGVPALGGCGDNDLMWVLDDRLFADQSRVRCMTYNPATDGFRMSGCAPRRDNPNQIWVVGAVGRTTTITNPASGRVLTADTFLSARPPNGGAAQNWLVQETGQIEFPDNPTG